MRILDSYYFLGFLIQNNDYSLRYEEYQYESTMAVDIANKHNSEISSVQKNYSSQGINYSIMKYIDCALWV